MQLKGTHKNPSTLLENPELAPLQFEDAEEVKALAEQRERWKVFKGSREYQLVSELVDPYVAVIEGKLAMGIEDIKGQYPELSLQEIQEARAELRGELRWWKMLKYGQEILEQKLADLHAAQDKLKSEAAKREEARRKKTEKYA